MAKLSGNSWHSVYLEDSAQIIFRRLRILTDSQNWTARRPDKQHFVSREVICRRSKVLSQIFRNIATKETSLAGVCPYQFQLYLHWAHTGVLGTRDCEENFGESEYETLVDAYFLGVKLEDVKYCDTIISATLQRAEESQGQEAAELPDEYLINRVYQQPPSKLGRESAKILKNALTQVFARESDPTKVAKILQDGELNKDFVQGLMKKLMEYRKPLAEVNVCDSHAYDKDEDCESEEQARKRRRED